MRWLSENAPVESVPYLHSVIPENRLAFLRFLLQETLKNCQGPVLEVGVYRGGTLKILAEVSRDLQPHSRVIGIDTFDGHPYSDGHRVHPIGKYRDTDKGTLEKALIDCSLTNVQLVKGQIEHIRPQDLSSEGFAFIMVDCDLYLPYVHIITHFWPWVKNGGVIYFEDYGHEHCPGATRAVDEFFTPEQLNIIHLPDRTRWSAWVLK